MELLELVIKYVTSDPKMGIVAVLSVVIYLLIRDRGTLVRRLDKREEQLLQVVREYHKGDLDVAQALGKIEVVLGIIKDRI